MRDLVIEKDGENARIRGGMEADGEVTLRVSGATLTVDLPEFGSAGYVWISEMEGTRQISSTVRPDGVRRGEALIGSPYMRQFLFDAPSPGKEALITLMLMRPWDDKPPERTVTVRAFGA